MKSQKKKSPAKVGKATPAKVTPKAAAKVTQPSTAAKVTPPAKPQQGGDAVKSNISNYLLKFRVTAKNKREVAMMAREISRNYDFICKSAGYAAVIEFLPKCAEELQKPRFATVKLWESPAYWEKSRKG